MTNSGCRRSNSSVVRISRLFYEKNTLTVYGQKDRLKEQKFYSAPPSNLTFTEKSMLIKKVFLSQIKSIIGTFQSFNANTANEQRVVQEFLSSVAQG